MSFQEPVKSKQPEIFSFPAIYDGVAVKITVAREDVGFSVFVDDAPAARIIRGEDDDNWRVTRGYLDDNDLLQDIGDRIEGRYKNFAS